MPKKVIKDYTKSQKESYLMYTSGLSIKEIAQERKLVEATIEKHLAQFVKLGKLEINEFVSKEKTDLITDYFNKSNSTLLRDAKAALGEDISYSEIRYVLSHMKFLGTLRIIWANTFLFP